MGNKATQNYQSNSTNKGIETRLRKKKRINLVFYFSIK